MLNLLLAILVSASLDSTTLMLGDQTGLHLKAVYDDGQRVEMPFLGQELIPGIEIVRRTPVDTLVKDGKTTLTQELTLTSFEDSLFYVAPLAFPAGEDTFYSDPLSLNFIQPFEIDTAMAITDIKDIQKAPIWVWGIVRWVLLAILLIALAVGGWFGWKWLEKHRKPESQAVEPELLRPAEEVALEKLDLIRQDKIWQEGKTKQYHTELTDVIREYIGRRFTIQSSEKTSDETLRALQPAMKEQRELFQSLKSMLQLADLVKFAKWTTTPDENERSLRTAYDFVHETTPTDDSLTTNDQQSNDKRPTTND